VLEQQLVLLVLLMVVLLLLVLLLVLLALLVPLAPLVPLVGVAQGWARLRQVVGWVGSSEPNASRSIRHASLEALAWIQPTIRVSLPSARC